MAIYYANVEEIEEVAKNVNKLAIMYDNEINNLFRRLSDVPTVTKEWIGNTANSYFKTILLDKDEYVNIGKNLHLFSDKLNKDAERIRNTVTKIVISERN